MHAVLECGTGSGSLTHSLARAVAPSGRVHTFEYHAPRAQAAQEEFQQNGLSELVTVRERDIQEEGFPAALHGCADALFLDVPGPSKVQPKLCAALAASATPLTSVPCRQQSLQRPASSLTAAWPPSRPAWSRCGPPALLACYHLRRHKAGWLQVQKMRGACAACGFWDVHVVECLLREYEVRTRPVSTLTSPAQPGMRVVLACF